MNSGAEETIAQEAAWKQLKNQPDEQNHDIHLKRSLYLAGSQPAAGQH